MKSINKIILLLLLTIPFYQCQSLKSDPDPRSRYEVNFNEERVKRGIPLIDENYKRRHDTPAAYQLWVNMEDTIPRHWRKYVCSDSDGYDIVSEGDDFLVNWKNKTVVLSFIYIFENEKNNLNPWTFIEISHFQPNEKELHKYDKYVADHLSSKGSTFKIELESPLGIPIDENSYHPEIEKRYGIKMEKIKELNLEEADSLLAHNYLKRNL